MISTKLFETKGEALVKLPREEPPKNTVEFRIEDRQYFLRTPQFCPDIKPEVYACKYDEIPPLGFRIDSRKWGGRSFVQICATIGEKSQYATGVLVGPKHVLTTRFFKETPELIKIFHSGMNLEEYELIYEVKATHAYTSPNHNFVILLLKELVGAKIGYRCVAYLKDIAKFEDQIYTIQGYPRKTFHLREMAEITSPNFVIDDKPALGIKITRTGKSVGIFRPAELVNVKKGDHIEVHLLSREKRVSEEKRHVFKSKIEKGNDLATADLAKRLHLMIQGPETYCKYLKEAIKFGYKFEDFMTETDNMSEQFKFYFSLVPGGYKPPSYYGLPYVAKPDMEEYKRVTESTFHYRWHEGLDKGTIGSPVLVESLHLGYSNDNICAVHTGHDDNICKADRITEGIFKEICEVLKQTWN